MSVPSHADVIVLNRRPELAALLRAKRLRAVVSEFEGLQRAPEALATVFDRGSPYIGRRVVRISEA